MSSSAQSNGKKGSTTTNSSAANTPASTPITNGNSQSISQNTPPPPNNNAPKYGTLIPNRIFVGGISANTTEGELMQLFSTYGPVKAAKIIQDRAGVSKGYGFITFDNEDDAKRPLNDAENIVLRERKLNIAPAIKKQPFNRAYDASGSPTGAVAAGNTAAQYFFPPATGIPFYSGGVAYYPQPAPAVPGDPNSQPTTVYQAPQVYPTQTGPPQAPSYPSMMFPQTIYMHQQYPPIMSYDFYNFSSNGGPPQYMVGGQNGPSAGGAGSSQGPPMPPSNSPPRPPPVGSGGGGCSAGTATTTNNNNGGNNLYNPPPPQLSQMHYNADTVFYNVPVFGGHIEGAGGNGGPIYAENMDVPPPPPPPPINGGIYNEVSHFVGGDFYHGYDGSDLIMGERQIIHSTVEHNNIIRDPSIEQQTPHFDHASHQQQQPPPSAPQPTMIETTTDSIDTTRQSKTPVVSILSMDSHQEKDFVSMQGGRRVKPLPVQQQQQPPSLTVQQQQNQQPPMMFHNYPHNQQHHQHHQMPPQHHHFYPTAYNNNNNSASLRSPFPFPQSPFKTANRESMNGYRRPRHNNTYNNNNNRKNQDSRMPYDNNSSRSSVRTDSNSSANDNQAGGVVLHAAATTTTTTTTTVVNPVSSNSYNGYNGSRTYQNSMGRRNLKLKDYQQQQQQQSNDKNKNFLQQQMRSNNGGYVMQPQRRNKRSTRRNNNIQGGGSGVGSGSLNEIGAGDAPLANNDVAEACNKMDGLIIK